jgi:hypothetical protein
MLLQGQALSESGLEIYCRGILDKPKGESFATG